MGEYGGAIGESGVRSPEGVEIVLKTFRERVEDQRIPSISHHELLLAERCSNGSFSS